MPTGWAGNAEESGRQCKKNPLPEILPNSLWFHSTMGEAYSIIGASMILMIGFPILIFKVNINK